MFRATLFVLLLAFLPTFMHAQRGTGIASSHGGVGAVRPNSGGHAGATGHPHGFVRSHETGRERNQRGGFGYTAFPYFLPDSETGWPEEEESAQEPNRATLVRPRDENRDREPAPPPLPAQVIEIPYASTSAETKPQPATVFVLTSGERLETQRYLLTTSSVSLTLHRDQRTIPLQMVDLDATIAANRDRGIDLRIPNDHNEISLRF